MQQALIHCSCYILRMVAGAARQEPARSSGQALVRRADRRQRRQRRAPWDACATSPRRRCRRGSAIGARQGLCDIAAAEGKRQRGVQGLLACNDASEVQHRQRRWLYKLKLHLPRRVAGGGASQQDIEVTEACLLATTTVGAMAKELQLLALHRGAIARQQLVAMPHDPPLDLAARVVQRHTERLDLRAVLVPHNQANGGGLRDRAVGYAAPL
mmetsp:Transcript_81724/g.236945  ORF Transcript_81724/g.236945 Transcript_81724/m.236945 type:complete len:213 (+) Transcript_81724:1763-2401(+)